MNLSQEALNSINSAYALGVKIEEDRRAVIQHQKMVDEQNNFFKRTVEDVVVRNPMIDQLQELLDQTREQNTLLMNQVTLMKEENERQKAQIEEVKVAEKEAKAEARKSKIFGWISFGVATVISIAALVVSIISLF